GIVEVLMHAAVLDQHHVAGLPGNLAAVVDVVAVALEHVEHRAVEVAVLLTAGLGCIGLDVGFDRLDDRGCLRAEEALAENLRPPLRGQIVRGVDALFLFQRLVEMAVGTFERAHEGALLRPAVPLLVLLFHLHRIGLVVADARGLDNACHPLRSCAADRGNGREKIKLDAGHKRLPRCAQSSRLRRVASWLSRAVPPATMLPYGSAKSPSWERWPCSMECSRPASPPPWSRSWP